jgi:imidazole glycerol-phosphate synthase subunit HisH
VDRINREITAHNEVRPRLALLDYGAGNLASVRKGFAAVGAPLFTPAAPGELLRADGIVVPGVGNFAATAAIDEPWRAAIAEALRNGVPLLGICLGLQWLFEGSDEAPAAPGLGVTAGVCHRLAAGEGLKVPHVGWNTLTLVRQSLLLDGIDDGASVYFTHTYAAPVTPECVATSTHGTAFASVLETGRVFGVQFHPEKSGDVGLRILRNFAEAARAR